MSYKITVERITTDIKVTKKWHQIHNKVEFDSKADPQYAYVSVEEEVIKTDTVYEQIVDKDFDLPAVITSVNTPKKSDVLAPPKPPETP